MSTSFKNIQTVLVTLLFLTAAPSGFAQERGLAELLSGKVCPLTVKLGEIDGNWRRVTVQASSKVTGNIAVNVSGNASANSQNNLTGALGSSQNYVTLGQTMSAHGRDYLVAYRLPATGLDLGAMLKTLISKTAPAAQSTLNAESALVLSLLDLQTLGSLEDVRPFDFKAEIADSENAARMISELIKAQKNESAPKEGKQQGDSSAERPVQR